MILIYLGLSYFNANFEVTSTSSRSRPLCHYQEISNEPFLLHLQIMIREDDQPNEKSREL